MDIRIPRLRDFFDLTNQQESISQELHTIPGSTPYVADLDQLPLIRTGATSIIDNVWLSVADAETLVTVEVETSPDVWEVMSLTESEFPAELEVFFQLAEPLTFPYSPRIIVNSTHAEQQIRITYTGMGSVPLARYFQQLYNVVESLQKAVLPVMIDMATYNFGRYDGRGTASKEVLVISSDAAFVGKNRAVVAFPGLTLDFDSSGNAEVAAFTNSLYWKRILISLDCDGSSWTVTTTESDEQQFQTNLVTPTIEPSLTTIGYIDVQNSGITGVEGEIYAIGASQIQGMVLLFHDNPETHPLRYWGEINTGEVDVPYAPFQAGILDGFGVFLKESGSAGQTRVNIYVCSDADPTGESVFVDAGSQAIVTANGAENKVYCPLANFKSSLLLFTSDQWFRFVIEEAATDAKHLYVTLHLRLQRF